MKQNRLKSKLLWAAIIAQIISLGQLIGLWKELGVEAGLIGDAAAGVLQLLVIVGVINDPTNPEGL
jgi:uncharacterized membrane protein